MVVIEVKAAATTSMLGVRAAAVPLRAKVAQAISGGQDVVLDFSGVEVTQAFADELVGVLVGSLGPAVLERLSFKGCSPQVRGVLQFVVADRARDAGGHQEECRGV